MATTTRTISIPIPLYEAICSFAEHKRIDISSYWFSAFARDAFIEKLSRENFWPCQPTPLPNCPAPDPARADFLTPNSRLAYPAQAGQTICAALENNVSSTKDAKENTPAQGERLTPTTPSDNASPAHEQTICHAQNTVRLSTIVAEENTPQPAAANPPLPQLNYSSSQTK